MAAKVALWAANGVATLFHAVRAPERDTRSGTVALPVILTAFAVCSNDSPKRRESPAAQESQQRILINLAPEAWRLR